MNRSFASITCLMMFALLSPRWRMAAQIPNEGFENWTDCLPDSWSSPNVCGVLMPITKVSAADSGRWAARGEVISLFGQLIAPVLQSGDTGEGTPISQRHVALQVSHRFSPVGGDRFGVNVAFYKNGNVVAQGAIADAAAAASYTPFTVTMTYVSGDVPDTAIIQITIVGPVTGFDFHEGSVMHVDSLAFTSGTVVVPPLSIQSNGSSSVVSWPPGVTGYVLQSTPSLVPAAWANVSGVVNNSYQVPPGTQMFFRLVKG